MPDPASQESLIASCVETMEQVHSNRPDLREEPLCSPLQSGLLMEVASHRMGQGELVTL